MLLALKGNISEWVGLESNQMLVEMTRTRSVDMKKGKKEKM